MRVTTPAVADIRRVSITGANPVTGELMVRDTNGAEFSMLGSTRPKGTGFPEVGEIWLIQRTGPAWLLRAQIGHRPPPVITGGVTSGSAAQSVLAALASLGLIVDHSTVGGAGSPLTEADVRAIVASIPVDGLADAVDDLVLAGNRIVELGAPVDPTDAATKAYVDAGDAAAAAYADSVVTGITDRLAFTFVQPVSALVWDITHDLGYVPSVTVVDSAGTVVVGHVEVVSLSAIRLRFTAEFNGTAYLS